MPTSENDVLDLMNRAAIDAPSMSLAPQAVLVSAQNRRRKQRQTRGGMALAAFAAAGAVWLGAGSGLGDLLGTQVDPAAPAPSPTEWDDSVSFEAPMADAGGSFARFEGSSLVRNAGDEFMIEFADGSPALAPVDSDLPAGVNLFTIGADNLVVSEPRFDATPVLGFMFPTLTEAPPGVPLTDGDHQVFVWLLGEDDQANEVEDIYWLFPDQVASSAGAAVITETVAEGDDEITVVIAPDSGQWGKRASSGLDDLVPLVQEEQFSIDSVSDGDLWVSVIPGWAENPMFSPPDMYDVQPMSTRVVGDYLVAWAVSSESGDPDGRPALVKWDWPADRELTASSTVTVQEQGDEVTVAVEGTTIKMTMALGDTGAKAAQAADGGALVIAALPEGITSVDGPLGPANAAPQVVVKMYSDVVAIQEGPGSKVGSATLPGEGGMVAVGSPAATEPYEQDVEVLPTLLFQGERGPQWAGGGLPSTVEVEGTQIRVSSDPDLPLWAANCATSDAVTGDIGSAVLMTIECIDPDGSVTPNIFAVSVLPTDVAESAQLVTMQAAISPDVVPDPIVTDIGDGLSLWAVPLGPVRTGGLADLEGIDLDGDGVVDEPPPVTE